MHAFYYGWYGTPQQDGDWFHWDHEVLDQSGRRHSPDAGDIASGHWPQGGPYSSSDTAVVARHCEQMRECGVSVVVAAWYASHRADQKQDRFAGFQERCFRLLLDAAEAAGLRVAVHHEPYPGRTAESVMEDARLIEQSYGDHPALFRHEGRRGALPLIYVYDSYAVPGWREALRDNATAYLVGLAVEESHLEQLRSDGFDGVYTYFAAEGFVWGSTCSNWQAMGRFCRLHGMLWIPCAGPGYDDGSVRPWNGRNTRARREGGYIEDMLRAALDSGPDAVGLTSFNEWHEGTQLEPAEPHAGYQGYGALGPRGYLLLAAKWADVLAKQLAAVPQPST